MVVVIAEGWWGIEDALTISEVEVSAEVDMVGSPSLRVLILGVSIFSPISKSASTPILSTSISSLSTYSVRIGGPSDWVKITIIGLRVLRSRIEYV